MITLAIDTATTHLCIGIRTPEQERAWHPQLHRAHAEQIADTVAACFAELALPMHADQVVVGIGPGSYTGVRIGASYAVGLAYARRVTTVGVSTLEGIAAAYEGKVAVSLDAMRGQCYCAIYQVTQGYITEVILPEQKMPQADWLELCAQQQLTPQSQAYPDALALIRQAEQRGLADWQIQYL